jgi:hypothetical protein
MDLNLNLLCAVRYEKAFLTAKRQILAQRTWHDRFVDWLAHRFGRCDRWCPYCTGRR